MSYENKKTVEIYKKYAKKFIETCRKHDLKYINEAKYKEKNIRSFLKNAFNSLPSGSQILEIGAGEGKLSKYLTELGYNICASDVADDFLLTIKEKGLTPLKFNVLEDEFKNKYHGILCWRVFVHFTKEDIEYALKKIYDALEENGILVFNVKNREVENIEGEWRDYPHEYHMGVARFFTYFYKDEIDEMINKIEYKLISFHKEGGENNDKWLVYVLEKRWLQNEDK